MIVNGFAIPFQAWHDDRRVTKVVGAEDGARPSVADDSQSFVHIAEHLRKCQPRMGRCHAFGCSSGAVLDD